MFAVLAILNSCAAIRFGRSTTVTIESGHSGDVVNILAIGPKKAEELQQVTLPYKYKVRHNNLPQRVDIFSENYIYEPFTIGAIHKGKNTALWLKAMGGTYGGAFSILGVSFTALDASDVGLPMLGAALAVGSGLIALGCTAETDLPDKKVYSTISIPVDSLNVFRLQDWYIKKKAIEDVYSLLANGDYKLSKAKASYLLESEPTAELYYLRGISSYYLGKNKKALDDLYESKYRLISDINPGLLNEVVICINDIEQSNAIKKEERKKLWSDIGGALLQAGVGAYSAYQENKLVNYRLSHGMTASGVVVDASKLSQADLNNMVDPAIFDPHYAIKQVMSQEQQMYQEFCRYNKKPDGSNYTLDEYRYLSAQAISYAKEQGVDILAEQREIISDQQKQMEENSKWADEQRKKDKDNWFAHYGYVNQTMSDISSGSVSVSSYDSNSNAQTMGSSNYVTNNVSNIESKEEDQSKLDSRQQFKSTPVSSEDYHKVKSVTLYMRDGSQARQMSSMSAELYKKGGQLFVKIGNKFYPRMYPNWQRFQHAIFYGDKQLYFND